MTTKVLEVEDVAGSKKRRYVGPATMFPYLNPRPAPLPFWKPLWSFIASSTRAPFLCAVIMHYLMMKQYRQLATFLTKRFGSQRMAFAIMLPMVHSITYTASFGIFEFIERNKLFEEYRIGRTPGQEPTWEMKRTAFWETARGWPSMIVGGQLLYYLLQKCGAPQLLDPIPSIWYTTVQISKNNFVESVLFYVVHRLLHYGPLFTRIHKKHHEFVGVKSVAAQSLHPVETLLQTIPNFLGALIFKTHPLVWLHFLGWRVYTGIEGHSGYSFRGSLPHKFGLTNGDDAAYHDCHHTSYGNFGTLWMDWIFGTHDLWVSIGEEDGYLALCKKREMEANIRAQEMEKS